MSGRDAYTQICSYEIEHTNSVVARKRVTVRGGSAGTVLRPALRSESPHLARRGDDEDNLSLACKLRRRERIGGADCNLPVSPPPFPPNPLGNILQPRQMTVPLGAFDGAETFLSDAAAKQACLFHPLRAREPALREEKATPATQANGIHVRRAMLQLSVPRRSTREQHKYAQHSGLLRQGGLHTTSSLFPGSTRHAQF